MPIYEYRCPKCNLEFELRRGFNESDAEILCPRCGAKGPIRLLSRFAGGGSAERCAPSPSGG